MTALQKLKAFKAYNPYPQGFDHGKKLEELRDLVVAALEEDESGSESES